MYRASILVGKLKGERPLGKPRVGLEGNIKENLKGIGHEANRIKVTKNTVQWRAPINTAMKVRVPLV